MPADCHTITWTCLHCGEHHPRYNKFGTRLDTCSRCDWKRPEEISPALQALSHLRPSTSMPPDATTRRITLTLTTDEPDPRVVSVLRRAAGLLDPESVMVAVAEDRPGRTIPAITILYQKAKHE